MAIAYKDFYILPFSGSKLALLKKHLNETMRQKRAESLKKREEMYALENEEGFEREKEEGEDMLDEEAELTGTDTDGESDDDIELQLLGRAGEDSDDGRDVRSFFLTLTTQKNVKNTMKKY